MSALTLAALGVGGGAALIAVSVAIPGRLLARPQPDAQPDAESKATPDELDARPAPAGDNVDDNVDDRAGDHAGDDAGGAP